MWVYACVGGSFGVFLLQLTRTYVPVSHHDHAAAAHRPLQRRLHSPLALPVQRCTKHKRNERKGVSDVRVRALSNPTNPSTQPTNQRNAPDVASSSTSTGGSLASARASVTRCFSPPLNCARPRSPTCVAYPSGNAATNSCAPAARAAASTAASVASGAP